MGYEHVTHSALVMREYAVGSLHAFPTTWMTVAGQCGEKCVETRQHHLCLCVCGTAEEWEARTHAQS